MADDVRSARPLVLVTRPEADARRTADTLARNGIESLVSPVIDIVTVDREIPARHFQAIALTSANAVASPAFRAIATKFPTIPAYAVGAQTAKAARGRGHADVRVAGPDAAALADALERLDPAKGAILHLCGQDVSGSLSSMMNGGPDVEAQVVYVAQARSALTPQAVLALRTGRVDMVLHFSARSARVFGELAARADVALAALKARHACLSVQVGEALGLPGDRIVIAERPTFQAMIEVVLNECPAEGIRSIR